MNVELTSVLRGSPIRSEYSKISVKEMTQRLDRMYVNIEKYTYEELQKLMELWFRLKSDVFEDEVVEFMKRIIKVE